MAIHDVDKTNSDRTSPRPNSHDVQGVARTAAGTISINPVTDASSVTGYVSTRDGRILINDGTDDRIIIGVLPDGTLGIVVSKVDVDVTTVFS